MAEGQRAGLAMFGVRPSWIGVVRSGGRNRVTLAAEGAETAGPELTRRTVELRVEVGPEQTALYAYSLDEGRTFQTLGVPIPLARFSWWKGSRPSLFSFVRPSTEGAARQGWVDVDWFRVQRASE